MKKFFVLATALFALASCDTQKKENTQTAAEPTTTATETKQTANQASVFFVSPQDGEVVTSPVKIKMGVAGMKVEPAGEVKEGMGHHHVIINGNHIEEGTIVPADERHIHFGKGQTETEIDLKPGQYTLTLQFADGVHKSYGEVMSKTINVEVKAN